MMHTSSFSCIMTTNNKLCSLCMHSLETSCSVKQGSKNTSSCIFEGCLNCAILFVQSGDGLVHPPQESWWGRVWCASLGGDGLVYPPQERWWGRVWCATYPWRGGPSQHTLCSKPTLHAQQAQAYFLVQAYPTPPQRFPAFGAWHLPQKSWCGESLVHLPGGEGLVCPPLHWSMLAR